MKQQKWRVLLSLLLAMCFCLSAITPVYAADGLWGGFGAQPSDTDWSNDLKDSWKKLWDKIFGGSEEEEPAPEGQGDLSAENSAAAEGEFLRIFHLDCGRKYFSVSEIEKIIDKLAENHYTHIELAFGNEGLRFVPNAENMAVGSYSGEKVVGAIAKGNKKYDTDQSLNYTVDSLTEQDMTEIFVYAKSKGIEIIPMLDIPGHMNAVIYAMQELDIDVSVFSYVGTTKPGNIGASFDTTNEAAVAFAKGLVENYITYFAGKGCKYFNIAGDECGFAKMSDDQYTAYATLMNSLNAKVKAAHMTTLMFNDGVNYKNKNLKGNVSFDKDIIICYWTGGDNYAVSTALQEAGYKLINTNVHWYYVAGNENGNSMFSYKYAINNMATRKCTVCDGGDAITDTGCMLAFWCDNPTASVNTNNLYNYIATLANNNPDYFKEAPKPTVTISAQAQTLYVGQSTTVSISGATSAAWSIDKTDVLDFSADANSGANVIVEAKKAGNAVVTATVDGEKYTVTIAVYDDAIVPAVSEIAEGKSVTLSLASSRAAEWKSSDDSVIKLNVSTSTLAADSVMGTNSIVAQAVEGAAGKEATVTAAYDGGTAEIKLKVVATRDDPNAVTVELMVGDSQTIENIGNDATITGSGIVDIAVAEINSKTVGGSTTYDRVSTIAAGEFYVSTSSSATNTPTVKLTFEDAGNGQYYIKNASGQYVYPDATRVNKQWSYSLASGRQAVTVTQNSNGYITISRSVSNTTAYLTLSGITLSAGSSNSSNRIIYLYKENKINGTQQNDLVFTGNGEGSTTYVVGGTTYNVLVTAPTVTETKTLSYNESFTLPDGSEVVVNSGEGYVTVEDGKVTAGTSDISGVEIKIDVKKNGYVVKHYIYTINVTAVDFSKISDLPIQLWITNNGIQFDGSDEWSGTSRTTNGNGNNRYAYWLPIKASSGSVYGEDGDMLSNVMPASISGVKEWGNVYWDKSFQNQDTVETPDGSGMGDDTFVGRAEWTLDLHKGSLLKSGSYQLNLGDNLIHSGTDFQYVRYYQDAWWVSVNRSNWTEIGTHTVTTSGTTSATGSGGTQIVAYYMFRTDITQEVTTDVVDWGESLPKKTDGVILDFAVKYPDGTTTVPSAFPVSGKTLYYNLLKTSDTYRRLYDIQGLETSGYEIYMITVTPTSDSSSDKITITQDMAPSYEYKGTEKVVWVDDEANLPTKFKDANAKYTSISGAIKYSVGGEPTIKGVEIYSRQGMLVTYYLRPVVTKDSLTVHYRMDSSTADFHYYNINVISGTFFKENIGLGDPKIGRLVNGDVENDQGRTQWVTSDLSAMPAISAEYRYAIYDCVRVERSEDGKDVFIYYTFRKDASFVIDFGSKLVITPKQVSENLADANITGMTVTKGLYGELTFDANYNIIYTPTTTLSGEERITVVYKGTNLSTGQDGTATFNIYIFPASNVLYEESFFNVTGEATNNWTQEGNPAANRTQATEKLGESINYGFDQSYAGDNGFSGGSALKTEVSVGLAADQRPCAEFTFMGTGFDIISECSNQTGMLFVRVGDANGKYVKSYIVDTYFNGDIDGIMTSGTMTYQIPVVRCTGLTYGTYQIRVKGLVLDTAGAVAARNASVNAADLFSVNAFDSHTSLGEVLGLTAEELSNLEILYMDENSVLNGGSGAEPVYSNGDVSLFGSFELNAANSNGKYDVYLDGFRVYNPLGTDADGSTSSQYEPDGENGFVYTPVYDALLEDESKFFYVEREGSKAVTADNIKNYKKNGPENEVYLASGASIAFKVEKDGASVDSIRISAKTVSAPTGMSAQLNGTPITSATEMYYEVTKDTSTGYFVITNDGKTVLSISELKVPSGAVLPVLTEADQQAALDAINAVLSAPVDPVDPEPEPEPEPETFEPQLLEAYAPAVAFRRWGATITVTSSIEEGMEVYIRDENGESMKLTPNNTRMVRWGMADTYRYSFSTGRLSAGTHTYYVYAVKDGLESAPVAVTITVW